MFRDKDSLLYNERGERLPLLEHPVIWTRRDEFPMGSYRLRREEKKQRFQWLLFFAVAMFSLFLLMMLIATVVRLGSEEIHVPGVITTTVKTTTAFDTVKLTTPSTTAAQVFLNLTSTLSTSTTESNPNTNAE